MLEPRDTNNPQRPRLTASRVQRFAPEGAGALLLAVIVVDLAFGAAVPFVVYPLLAAGLATALVARRGEKDRARLADAGDLLAATCAELALVQSKIEGRVGDRTRELEARNAELTVLAQIAKTVNMSLDIEQVYLAFLTESRRLLPFDQASIAVYTPDRTTLRLMRVHDVEGALVGEQHEVDAATSIQASLEPSLIEDIASPNTVVSKMAETGSRMRTLASFTAQASIQIAEQLAMAEADQRILRVAALSHALGIFPEEDPEDWNVEDPWGLDPELDATYLKLGRLFVVASPGLDLAVHAVHHHRPLSALGPEADTRFTRILAVSEAYARRTMPGAEPQLSSREAIAVLRGDETLDQEMVERLALAVRVDTQNAA